jgi:arginine-tRNA-protein transferase
VRIPVGRFVMRRSLRRVLAANRDLAPHERPAAATPEQFRLFLRYQRSRHHDSDMARMTSSDYAAMVEEGGAGSSLFEFRTAEGRLAAVMLGDRLTDGFSAVYSFFDPDQPQRSLGTFMVLSLVEQARTLRLPYVYLGYWIAESRKMTYKMRFQPLEALTGEGWQTVSEIAAAPVA